MKATDTRELAIAAFKKHLEIHGDFDHYSGILSMHALARLATETADEPLTVEIRQHLLPYARGERDFPSKFPNYNCGGNAAAWLHYQGELPEASEALRHYAEQIMREAPRSAEGIICHPEFPDEGVVWIDIAFAISPFLLYTGLALNEPAYVEEAYLQTTKLTDLLENDETGLFFQCKNTLSPGHLTEDHWSRGNGWGAFALAELAAHLPADHPFKADAVRRCRKHLLACMEYQDADGLWHQEMTREDSYVETSGSALILYALGVGLAHGWVDAPALNRFQNGLRGMLSYISEELDIYHTCRGCRCPGEGTKLDYMAQPPVVNDRHAFGPVVLLMGQAHLLGIDSLSRDAAGRAMPLSAAV